MNTFRKNNPFFIQIFTEINLRKYKLMYLMCVKYDKFMVQLNLDS